MSSGVTISRVSARRTTGTISNVTPYMGLYIQPTDINAFLGIDL